MHPALIGQICLWLTLAASVGSAGFSLVGWLGRRPAWARAGRTLALVAFAAATVASAALLGSLLSDDFSVRYVAQRSSRSTPLMYKLGAWWGGQEGSLLFWLWLLLGYAALVVTARPSPGAAPMWPVATAVLMAVASFFAAVTAAIETPFVRLDRPPLDGGGLNPLLQSPSMLAHPVTLYLGYIGLTVPFAFMVGALLTERRDADWVPVARRWALVAWLFLGAGILLGGEWAYKELGWGGYWGWDPVENASLIPWLLLTAYVHSSLAQEHRGTLARWNAGLLAAAFLSVMLGTFVTRSGILASVHAFAESPSGPYFLAFVGLLASFSVWLLGSRWHALGSSRVAPGPAVSREGAFVAANVVLVALAFAVGFGTAVPIVSRFFGPGISVQAPYFERVSAPLFALMLGLMGVAWLLPWRSSSGAWLRRHVPELVAGAGFVALLALGGIRRPLVALGLGCAFFAGVVALGGLLRRARVRGRAGSVGLWQAAGGLLAHLGVAVVAVAAVASTGFQVGVTRTLEVGKTATLAGYTLRYDGLGMRRVPGATEVFANLEVFQGNRYAGRLQPGRRIYDGEAARFGPTTEVAVRRYLQGDLYVALAGWDDEAAGGRAAFEMYFNPLVSWMWVGGLLTLAGTALALATRRGEAPQRAAREQVVREALRAVSVAAAGRSLPS